MNSPLIPTFDSVTSTGNIWAWSQQGKEDYNNFSLLLFYFWLCHKLWKRLSLISSTRKRRLQSSLIPYFLLLTLSQVLEMFEHHLLNKEKMLMIFTTHLYQTRIRNFWLMGLKGDQPTQKHVKLVVTQYTSI
jgi:hypothetical protein